MVRFKLDKDKYIEVSVLPIKQNKAEFFIGVAKAEDVLKICSATPRGIAEDELGEYTGIQRPLNPSRQKEIQTYVKTEDASFPNSIILAIKQGKYIISPDNKKIFIEKNKESANIIDGQHRLSGFFNKTAPNFELILTLLPELELEQQAYLFSVINTKAIKINPSHNIDLYALATAHTPEKIAHNIAEKLNKDNESPWQGKIKMLGRKEEGQEDAILSQSTLTREIINLIYNKKDAYKVRDILRRNDNKRRSLEGFYSPRQLKTRLFWDIYLDGEDGFLYTVICNYFCAVKQTFPQEWNNTKSILTKTTGYSAFMKVFARLFNIARKEKNFTIQFFQGYLKKAKESNKVKRLTSENYNPGGQGESNLKKDLLNAMGIK